MAAKRAKGAKRRIPTDDPKAEIGDFSRPRPPDAMDKIAQQAGVARERVIEEWRERAAIREYLGGMTRAEAELAAMRDIEDVFRPAERQSGFTYTGGIRYVPDDDTYW